MARLDILRRLDAYPKTLDEFSQKTICGAAVTVISSVIMIWLLVHEFYAYIEPKISEDLFVDTTRSHKLKINLDMYIPSISCDCEYHSLCVCKCFIVWQCNLVIGIELTLLM